MKSIQNKIHLHLYDILLFYVSIVSIFCILLLSISKYSAFRVLILGAVVLSIFFLIFKPILILKDERFGILLPFILFIAIVLRLPGYLYVMGGQDQGTYINMSRQYELQGSLYYTDHFRQTLNDAQKKLYDKHMPYLLPGFQQWGPDRSHYVMKFYPLHPAWMAIFGTLFGRDNRVLSLTFFSLISIVSFYLLGYEISGKNKRVGYVIALLLALNPTHVFFSKFPVTELVALAFTSSSYYYLLKYYKDNINQKQNSFDLILSLLMINGFFYTRMSSFMYIPFYCLMAVVVIFFVKNLTVKKHLLIYLFSVGISFSISYLFYRFLLTPLFYEVYGPYVKQYLGTHSEWKLLSMFIFFIFTIFFVSKLKSNRLSSFFKSFGYALMSLLSLLFFLLVFYKSIFMVVHEGSLYTDKVIRWVRPFLGWEGFRHITMFQVVNSISLPVLILLIFWNTRSFIRSIKNKYPLNPAFFFLSSFIWNFVLIYTFWGNNFLYNYYHSRYILSEIIPYTLLLASVVFLEMWQEEKYLYKRAAQLLFLTTILYFCVFTSVQMLGKEMPGLYSYNLVDRIVSEKDILFINKDYRSGSAMMAPLKYYYNKNIFITDEGTDLLENPVLHSLSNSFQGKYLLMEGRPIAKVGKLTSRTLKLTYSYFSVGISCSAHTYSYLPESLSIGLEMQKPFGCLSLPRKYNVVYKTLELYSFDRY